MKVNSEINEEDKFKKHHKENYYMDNLISLEQKIDKKINELTYYMNKKEDDLKNLINEKDIIIKEMNKKLIEQEKMILTNKYETLNLILNLCKMFSKFNNELKEKNINANLDFSFLNVFEKYAISNSKIILEKKDIEIASKIYEYIEKIASFNMNKKLKINLKSFLINCEQRNIEALIYRLKKEINQNNSLNQDEKDYELRIIKEVFKKIVPTFCQDIIASMISCELGPKYNQYNEIIIEIYKESRHFNFESFFKKIESKKNIIYTFSKITEDIFDKGNDIENKYGIFNRENAVIEHIQSTKEDKILMALIQLFNNEEKKILIFRFLENEPNNIKLANYFISSLEKVNLGLKDKLILFIIHKQRLSNGEKSIKEDIDLLSFNHDEYHEIFIDNLKGKENSDILEIMKKKDGEILVKYIENSKFVDNNIFNILSYMNFKIIYQTKSLNLDNFKKEISEKIIKNEKIKEFIKNNLKAQGYSIKRLIKDVFVSDINGENSIEFIDIINNKIKTYRLLFLLRITFYSFKENMLIQLINNEFFDLFMQNKYLNSLINTNFQKIEFNFCPAIKMALNSNKIIIYNGLKIPKSKSHLDKLINYINNEIYERYINNEEIMRKQNTKEQKIEEIIKEYNKEIDRLEQNSKTEINKSELFESIYNQNNMELKQLLLEDYFVYFVIKYIENKDINYEINEYILNFLKLIVKMKLNEKPKYEFKNTIDEFVKILLFSQGYKKDLYNIFDILKELQKYCKNIEEYTKIEEKIKNVICERSNKNQKIFSHTIFLNIIESLIRGILLFSIELIKKDKDAFSEFFKFFKFLEDSLQKVNIKYNLNSKEIYIIKTIIKIEEECKYNLSQFEKNYEKIMDNILKQTNLLYQNNFNHLYNSIIDLNKILNSTFVKKTQEYSNLLLYLFTQQYRNIDSQEIKIKLVENFIKNKLLIKKSKFLLHLTLKDLKPELFNKNKPLKGLIGNFMNITDNNKYLIKIYNNINSEEFNEILLFFFEGQCQSYFNSILMKYKSEYKNESREKCYKELLSKTSIEYLKKAMHYLYDHKNNNDNKLLKLYSLAFIKTYLYYYVEIYCNYFDYYNWEEINNILNYKDEKNELVINMRNIYLLKLFYKKFENFEMFKNYIFVKNKIPICKELLDKNPQSLKEIIQENYEPSIYDKNKYPDI